MKQNDDPDIVDDHWLDQAMEGEDAAGCISVGGLAVDMGWYKKDRGMTPDEIAAERERFEAAWYEQSPKVHPPIAYFQYGRCGEYLSPVIDQYWQLWLKRTAIARAEQAELRAEIERVTRINESKLYAEMNLDHERQRSKMLERTVAELRAEIERLRGRVRELGRENRKLSGEGMDPLDYWSA